jgi:hypothetical protein
VVLLVSGKILFALLVAFVPAFVSCHRSVIQAFERTIGLFIASLAADYDLRRAYDLGSIISHRIVDKPDIAVGVRGWAGVSIR